MQLQRSRNIGGTSDARPCAYVGKYPAEDQCIVIYGMPEGEKCIDDVWWVRNFKVQIWESKLAIGTSSTNQQIHTDRTPVNRRDLLQKTHKSAIFGWWMLQKVLLLGSAFCFASLKEKWIKSLRTYGCAVDHQLSRPFLDTNFKIYYTELRNKEEASRKISFHSLYNSKIKKWVDLV